MYMSLLASVVHLAFVASDGGPTEKPLALKKAKENRSALVLQTARIEFSVTDNREGDFKGQTLFYTFKAAGNDYIMVHQGDQHCIVALDGEGNPVPAAINKPWHCLYQNGEVWQHPQDSPDAQVWGEELGRHTFSMNDVRELGLNPLLVGGDLDQYLRKLDCPPLEYQTMIVDGLHVVSGTTRDSTYRWWIDPERDWNVVKAEVSSGEKKVIERQFFLQLDPHDGIWFPQRVETSSFAPGVDNPLQVIELHATEFNRVDHPVDLTPADIGVEVGTFVVFHERAENAAGYWDGEDVVSHAEYRERVETGELSTGPSVARALARVNARARLGEMAEQGTSEATTQPAPPRYAFHWDRFETQWEAYTRVFIERYRLSDEQAQKAWTICKDCQAQGRAYVASRRHVFEEIDRRLALIEGSGCSDDDKARRRRLEAERAMNREPLTRIFERQLKPRLDRLPTRAQRQAVEFGEKP